MKDVDLSPESQRRIYAFVCGLHRSGTTLIAESAADHPMVSGFRGTGAIEDEGQYLQTVLPLESAWGGAGRFGFDSRAHLTEASSLNSLEAAGRLRSEWHRYWDESKSVLLEKTPANLLRMRLLQDFFRPSYFIIVTRHPIAAALATMKWTEGNLFSLLYHWVHCYRIARADAAMVDRILWVSYEAFIAEPMRQRERIAGFLGIAPYSRAIESFGDANGRYFALWQTQYLADLDRSIAQPPAASDRTLAIRLMDRLRQNRRERTLPLHRRRPNLRQFHDALDAVAALEPAIAEFGYSFFDLARYPKF